MSAPAPARPAAALVPRRQQELGRHRQGAHRAQSPAKIPRRADPPRVRGRSSSRPTQRACDSGSIADQSLNAKPARISRGPTRKTAKPKSHGVRKIMAARRSSRSARTRVRCAQKKSASSSPTVSSATPPKSEHRERCTRPPLCLARRASASMRCCPCRHASSGLMRSVTRQASSTSRTICLISDHWGTVGLRRASSSASRKTRSLFGMPRADRGRPSPARRASAPAPRYRATPSAWPRAPPPGSAGSGRPPAALARPKTGSIPSPRAPSHANPTARAATGATSKCTSLSRSDAVGTNKSGDRSAHGGWMSKLRSIS